MFDVEVGGIVYRESEAEEAGDEPVVARAGDWVIGLSICYDVRFPELYRVLALEGAEALTVPSISRSHWRDHWEALLRARAIENSCYVVEAAQIGRRVRQAKLRPPLIADRGSSSHSRPTRGRSRSFADLDRPRLSRRAVPSLREQMSEAYRWPVA